MLLTEAVYRRITGDTVTPSGTALNNAMEDAQRWAESFCRRELESKSRTEYVSSQRDLQGRWSIYPRVTPITLVSSDYEIATPAKVYGPSGDLTYTAGYTSDNCPWPVLEAIALKAQNILAHSSDGGDPSDIDPEGNVIPVVPPFSNDVVQAEASSLLWPYIRKATTGL